MVAGPHTGGVCPLLGCCSHMEKHSSRHRCFRPTLGSCSGRSGNNRRVVCVGDSAHNCSQGMDGLRVHSQEELGLPVGKAGHMACGQSKCQACIYKPGYSERCLAVQKGCGPASPAARAPDPRSPSVCEVRASPARRFSQQTQGDSRLASEPEPGAETVSHLRKATDRSHGHKSVSPAASLLLSNARRECNGRGQLGTELGQVRSELCVPTSSYGGTGTEQDTPVQILHNLPRRFPVDASSNMVSKSSTSVKFSSTQVSCQSHDSGGSSTVLVSSQHALWRSDEVRRVEAFWSGRNKGGRLSARAESIIQSGWAKGTKSVYGLGYRYYTEFCRRHQMDPLVPDPVNLLNFLTFCFEVKKSEYRTLNCYRSAVSSTLPNNPTTGQPVGQDHLVSRFFRGVRRLRPPRVKLFPTWSISTVLNYLKSLGGSSSLSLDLLLIKTCFLVSLVCCKRPACLRNMKKVPGYWDLSMNGLRCQTLGLGKTELHHISPPIIIEPHLEDPQLCPVYHLVRLDKLLDRVRPKDVTDFWLSSRKPHKPVSTQTLCKWLKKVIIDSGALSGSARDVRSVGSSTAAQAGLDIGRIMEAGDWRRLKTFQSHYFKPQKLDCITNILKVASI